jgi:hypothetical protein
VAWAGTRRILEGCRRALDLACIAVVMTAWRAVFRLALA